MEIAQKKTLAQLKDPERDPLTPPPLMIILGDMRAERRPTIQIVLEDDTQRDALLRRAEDAGFPSFSAYARFLLKLPRMEERRGAKKGRPRRKRMVQAPLFGADSAAKESA